MKAKIKEDKIVKDKRKVFKGWHATPLKASFMLTSMLGFLISAYWVYPKSFNFGVSFMLIFTLMFIASLVSLSKASVEE